MYCHLLAVLVYYLENNFIKNAVMLFSFNTIMALNDLFEGNFSDEFDVWLLAIN